MSFSIDRHITMAQSYYNDIESQYQAILALDGADAMFSSPLAGAVDYHQKSPNLEINTAIKTTFSGASEDFGTLDNPITLGNSFTQEMWIRPIETSAHMAYKDVLGFITSQHHLAAPCIWLHQNGLHYGFGDGKTWSAPYTDNGHIKLRAWNHIAVTFHQGVYKSFVNGKEIHSDVVKCQGKQPLSTPIMFKVGSFGCERWHQPFKGEIDDIRIWDIARTVYQIKENMYSSLHRAEGNLKGVYSSRKVTELTDYDLYSSTPAVLSSKAKAIHTLAMKINDTFSSNSKDVDQRKQVEQLQSYVNQLSRIHQAFSATKQRLSLEKQIAGLQSQLQTEQQKVMQSEQAITNLTQDKQSLQQQAQSNQQTTSSSQLERVQLINKNESLENLNIVLKHQIESLERDKTKLHDEKTQERNEKLQAQQERAQFQTMLLTNMQMMQAMSLNQTNALPN